MMRRFQRIMGAEVYPPPGTPVLPKARELALEHSIMQPYTQNSFLRGTRLA